jgi:ribosomal protein L16 Arg81 hydroxylase
MDVLTHLLAPLDRSAFFRETWERRHCLLRRSDPAYYAQLLSLDDVEAVICFIETAALRPDVRVIRHAGDRFEAKPAADQGIASLRDVHDAYSRGFTVVVNNVERRWAPVTELCRGLEGVFQCRVTANIYLTPRGAQGFPRHYDTHDVFVLQIAGTKGWRVYGASAALPMPAPPGERPLPPASDPGETCELTPGDLLYLPRGHEHDARTDAGSSLHLTVGVHVTRWADLLADAVRQAAEGDVRLREAVPPEWLRGEAPARAVSERLSDLLRGVGEAVDERTLLAEHARKFLADRRPSVEGHFGSLDRLADLSPASRLRRRPHYTCLVTMRDGAATLRFGGNWVDAPARLEPQLSFVAANETFTPADLPGPLDEEAKLVLVRRLVREGLLAIDGPESA